MSDHSLISDWVGVSGVVYGFADIDVMVQTYLQPHWKKGAIFALTGEIGAGKTTLLKAFLKSVDGAATILSPTYAYRYSFKTESLREVRHIDLYRVDSIASFYAIEDDDILSPSDEAVTFIEWPEVIKPLLLAPEVVKRVIWLQIDYHPRFLSKRIFSSKWCG